jgi:peptidoglycan/LPS O-acetylase OafA/YrhL
VLRILPLYYLCVFALFCVFLPLGPKLLPHWFHRQPWTQVGGGEAVWYWLHLSNWRSGFGVLQISPITHFWSLAIEEQFYLVWPMVVLFLSEARLLKLSVVLIVVSILLRNVPAFQDQLTRYPDFIYRLTPFRLDPLAFGAILALLVRRSAFPSWARRWLPVSTALGIGVLASILIALRSGLYRHPPMSRFGFTAVSLICFSAVAYGFVHAGGDTFLARSLRFRPLVSIGTYSYGMYVLHMPVAFFWPSVLTRVHVAGHRIPIAIASAIAGAVIAYGMALVSWHLVEHRFLALKDRFS